jgi:hypothetical protein
MKKVLRLFLLTIATVTCIPFCMCMLLTMFLIGIIGLLGDLILYTHWIVTGSNELIRAFECGMFLPMYVLAVIHGICCLKAGKDFGYPLNNDPL